MKSPSAYCPACRSEEIHRFDKSTWTIGDVVYSLAQCAGCGSAFTQPIPGDATLQDLYGKSFDYRWYRDHYDAKLKDCRIRIRECSPQLGRRVLDFGGGVGYFSRAAREAGLESITFDPYVSSFRPDEGVWDCVVALHVLEHSNNPDRTISEIKQFLVPGGRIIVAVPNFACSGYRQMGMRWVWAQPPLLHVIHFTATGLDLLLRRHAFEKIEVTFHERWDANLYCDLAEAARFHRRDALWSLRILNRFGAYRRWIANRNGKLRFEGLERARSNYDPYSDAHAELQVTAVLSSSRPAVD